MRKVLGSLSLLVLLLNTLLTPITYAWEYEEIIVITSDSQKNQVEENGEEEDSSEFSVEEKNEEDILDEENEEEENDEDAEVDSWTVAEEWIWDIEEIRDDEWLTWEVVEWETWSVVEEWTWDTIEVGNWETGWLTWETINSETWSLVEENTWAVSESTWWSTSEEWTWEVIKYNETPITWERTYDDVTVRVEALSWIFPEWTELVIEAIKWWNLSDLKDQLVEEKEEIKNDTTIVAFDITFIYSWEEVQPKDWEKVKVTFDYSNNDDLVGADKDETQEVKVYHIEDKDEKWNELEKEEQKIVDVTNKEESGEEWIAVADGESFSVYAVVVTSWNWLRVTYNLSWWYWIEDHTYNPKTVIYTGKATTMLYRTPSKTWFMFMWWFDGSGNKRKDWVIEDGMDVYAKWQEFWDLDIYILKNQTTKAHYTFMDRNMWATELYNKIYCNCTGTNNTCSNSNDCRDSRTYDSYGYYYQWWNNYGFDSYAETPWALSNTTTDGTLVEGQIDVSDYSWDKPYSSPIFAGGNSNGNTKIWVSWTYKNLWWWEESEVSHKQWPCPDWYHVPDQAKWTEIANTWTNSNYRNKIYSLHEDFLLPAASYRKRATRFVDTNGLHHYRYLTSTYNYLFGDKDGEQGDRDLVIRTENISNGLSVRCLKNDPNTNSTVFDMLNIDLRWWEKAIISIVSWEVVSLQNPIRNNDKFRWWYKTGDYSWNPIWIWSWLLQWDHLYAKWCADWLIDDGSSCVSALAVTFDSVWGSSVPTQFIYPWNKATKPEDPEKDWYTFSWWYTDKTYITEFDFTWTSITSNTTVYAKWILNEYNISYDLDWGFMKLTSNGIESNLTGYTITTPTITIKNPGKLNAIFVWWTWTDLSEATTSLSIPRWSTGDKSYLALYECEPGHSFNQDWECVWIRNADWTLNFDVWQYSTLDFQVWESKITMLDRNLGASSDDINNTWSFWFNYKWWNNYWFSVDHTSKYGATTVKVSDVSWYWPWTASWYYLSHNWIYWSVEDNWFEWSNYNLWWDETNTQVARQWPCPDLYHVPFNEEINWVIWLLNAYPNTEIGSQCIATYGNKRLCFQNIMKIPSVGYSRHDYSNSSQRNESARVFLWMSSRASNGRFSAFHSTANEPTDENASMKIWDRFSKFAMPIRCFKNTDVVTVNYELNWWSASRWNNPQDLPSKTWYWYELKLGDGAKNPLEYTINRANSTFSWWYLDSEYTKPFTWNTVYPYVTQDTTFYAKFDCVSPYVQSDDGQSCELPKVRVTYDAQAHSWTIDWLSTSWYTVDHDTQITLPTLESSSIVSLKTWYNFIWWTTTRGWTEPVSNVQTIVWDITFYPIFKKDAIEKNMTFNLNWSEWFTYSWTDYLANTTLHLCTIEERYNNQEDLTGCEAIIQLPPISWSDNTPEVSWWSTWLDIAAIPVWANLKITVDKDDIVNFYAQTYSLPKTYRLNYEYWTWVLSLVVSSWSCEIAWTVNGVAQSWSCNILLPQLVLKQWFKDPLWYNRNHWYTWDVEVFWDWMGNWLNLEDGDVLTWIAHAKDDVKYVVKHYYQMLNADWTELLENQYKSGRVEEKAWLAHSIIELSWEKFDDLMWYTYYTWTIQTTADEVDISGITTATTWEINPEWTLVITLFYTRDTYRVDWIDQGNTIKTENNLPYWVKVNYYKPVDPTKAKDEHYTYTFVWWYDNDDSLLTWDTLLETWTIYTSKYREDVRQYKITFVDDNGDTLKESTNYDYWTLSWDIVKPADPTKDPTPGTGYTFAWWYPEIWNVTQDQVYTATYDQTIRQYIITFVDDDNTIIKSWVKYNYWTLSWNIVKPANPTKDPTYDTVYTFAWWNPSIENVTHDQIYKATYDSSTRQYTIRFVNYDGIEITSSEYDYWTASWDIVRPVAPWKPSDGTYDYIFKWWNPEITNVTTWATYTATYSWEYIPYLVSFKWSTWAVIASGYYHSWAMPVAPSDPQKASTDEYDYIFVWWNPVVSAVTWNITYEPIYTENKRSYTITWNNRDGTGLKKDENMLYWSTPVYGQSDPIRPSTLQTGYTFAWWLPWVHQVTWPQVYTAFYNETTNSYPITWKNDDGTDIMTSEVLYWEVPSYTWPGLTKTWHTFSKWTPDLEPVVWTASYTASYIINQYKVTPEKWDWVGDILWWWTYDYGTEVVLTWIAKEWYHFEWWVTVKEFTVEVPAKDITVILTAQPNTYYVHFKGNGWEGVMNDQEFTYDQEQALIPNAYTRNWYSFVSWTDGEWGIYKDKAVVKNLVTSWVIYLIAQWIEWDVPGPTPPTPTPIPSWWGGWWWSWRPIDKKTDDKEHDSAEEKQQEVIRDNQTEKDSIIQTWGNIKQMTWDDSVIVPGPVYQWTEEELTAYKFAYKYWITTLAPENAAMPDEYVQRWHMAKMVVNYALNVLHWKLPEKLPKQCKWMDWPNAWESQEIKDYAEKACALWIMWIDMKYFQPKKYVTRAQFGTIIGRLLRWKLASKPYYVAHLRRLKERWIMTQIENPENRIEIRKWAWLMFMRMEKYQ